MVATSWTWSPSSASASARSVAGRRAGRSSRINVPPAADRLQRIHDALPPSHNRDAMLEHRIPRDPATEIAGAIEAVLVDEIRPAIEYLEAASRVTAEELRERFERGGSR